MRHAFPIALTFCTQFASTTNAQLPAGTLLTLLHGTGSGGDQIAVGDAANNMSLLLDVPVQGCTAIASWGTDGPLLLALPTANGATIYQFTLVGDQLQGQVVSTTVNGSVRRLQTLSESVLAIVMADEIVIEDMAADSTSTLLPATGAEFLDLAPTSSGFAVLSKSASSTTITRYAADLSVIDNHSFPTITLPTSLCELNSTTLCVGTATPNGAMFSVSYVGSGGSTTATATPIAPATSEVIRTVSKPDVWVVGTFHHIRIIPKNAGPLSAPIELDGTLRDINVVRAWN